jgi:hypothetical protein
MLNSLLLLGLFCCGLWAGTLRWGGRIGMQLAALCLLGLTSVGMYVRSSAFSPPVQWLVDGRNETWLFAGTVGVLSGFVASWMKSAVFRMLLLIACGMFVLRFAIMPHFGAFLARDQMTKLTGVVRNEVCKQSSPITCGPAAAATALWHLGIPSSESELAVLSGTSVFGGTPEDVLAQTLVKYFADAGLMVEIGYHERFPNLKSGEIALTAIKLGGFTDHFLCILTANDHQIKIADPLGGIVRQESREQFEADWKRVVVLLRRRAE